MGDGQSAFEAISRKKCFFENIKRTDHILCNLC